MTRVLATMVDDDSAPSAIDALSRSHPPEVGDKSINDLVADSGSPSALRADYTPTPDLRYFVVRGRLWRLSNPCLDPSTHERLVRELMNARRSVKTACNPETRISARLRVDAAKRGLGERGDVWWSDGAPDYNRQRAVDTPYASWYTQEDQ